MIAEFRDHVDFLIIYIEEAHASDGWKFANNFDINNHRTIQDRLHTAQKLRDIGSGCPIVVDRMDNQANSQYGGLFERLYIILNSVVVYAGGRGPVDYKLEEVHDWLKNYLRS